MASLPLMVYEQLRCEYHSDTKVSITSPEDILTYKQVAAMSIKPQEHFSILTLDGASKVIKYHNITKGLLNHSLIHPREVYRTAIKDNAHSIIALHNHPSGSLEPSQADITITKQLAEAGKIIGIELLDHIIISRDGVQGMRQLGYV